MPQNLVTILTIPMKLVPGGGRLPERIQRELGQQDRVLHAHHLRLVPSRSWTPGDNLGHSKCHL